MPYKEAEASTTTTIRLTGPFGVWWYPILVRLAQYFPWAEKLLVIITAKK
jgi:hypothetical protein